MFTYSGMILGYSGEDRYYYRMDNILKRLFKTPTQECRKKSSTNAKSLYIPTATMNQWCVPRKEVECIFKNPKYVRRTEYSSGSVFQGGCKCYGWDLYSER